MQSELNSSHIFIIQKILGRNLIFMPQCFIYKPQCCHTGYYMAAFALWNSPNWKNININL
jgi:hypothetical protein